MQTRSTFAAALTAFFAVADAHMIMKTPKPFGNPDNSPLTGTNFPCKLTGSPATFYKKDGIDNTMAIGETQTLSFTGSAVHGGGSCQLAITSDAQPSKSTSWQVILSIEGGCPSKDGSGPSTYDYKIPDSVAAGDYVFAWTWQSKLAGQPEYYMNCAPITVTGGSAKRSANETLEETDLLFGRDDSLPELWVGNMASINSCKSVMSSDTVYPNPGPNVEKPNPNANLQPATGSDCIPPGSKANAGSSSGSDASGSGSEAGTSSAQVVSSATTAGAQPTSGFITSTIAATTSAIIATTSAAAAAPSETETAAPAGTSSAASGSSSSTPSGGLSGACTDEGMFNCVGGSSYQQCASGSWTTLQAMPATTKCQEGQTATLWGRNIPARRLRRAE
ncbi:hypothetical protein F5Y15DRAFT_419283 [Xylariaceae sp. FL0016]|nr:hypothetical protein F5Y15DRAFT_419283 [Xylariaceae sp. FL0016]